MSRTSGTRRVATPLPLGSLTQPGARQRATCRACGSDRVTEIAMQLTDGTPVDFVSCHHCESRSWTQQGHELAFDRVLAKTRKIA